MLTFYLPVCLLRFCFSSAPPPLMLLSLHSRSLHILSTILMYVILLLLHAYMKIFVQAFVFYLVDEVCV